MILCMLSEGGLDIPMPHDPWAWGVFVMVGGFFLREGWAYWKETRVEQKTDERKAITDALTAVNKQLGEVAGRLEAVRERVDTRLDTFSRDFEKSFRDLHTMISENDAAMAAIQSRLDYCEREIGLLREEKHKVREDVTRSVSSALAEITAKLNELNKRTA